MPFNLLRFSRLRFKGAINFSDIFAMICLFGSVWTVIATSTDDISQDAQYHVKTDCVSPVVDEDIILSGSQITSPSGTTFETLGFPSTTLILGQDSSGTQNGVERVCTQTYDESNGSSDTFIYTCSDNGEFVCNAYFESK